MNRKLSGPLLLLVFSCSLLSFQAAAAPNIVFILADDLGVNDLSCYGRRDHRTPHLDRLAADGMRFTSAYCAQPICSPSRAAILTGKTPARLHLTTYLPGRPDSASQKLLHPLSRQQLPLEEKTLAELLKPSGYISACIGKWHLGGQGFLPANQGFDLYFPGQPNTAPSASEGGKGEFELTAEAEKFIENNRQRPFFLYLAHNSPHIPFEAKPALVEKNHGAFNPVYAALIETLDESVGRLLAKLEALHLATNTIVIFTSDNGGLHVPEGPHETITHNTPFRAGKGFLYEGGLRIPLIVRWPGKISRGRVVTEPVINTDWLPTLLAIAGEPAAGPHDGASLARLLTEPNQGPSRRFYWHFPHYTNQGSRPAGAVREGDWKLIEHYEDGHVELFNLIRDPGERNDLSSAEPERVHLLRALLASWRASVGAQTNLANPNFDPALHGPLYVDMDVSLYDPSRNQPQLRQRLSEWRKRMNTVVQSKARRN